MYQTSLSALERKTKMKKTLLFATLCLLCLALYLSSAVSGDTGAGKAKTAVTFARHVAPILQKRCEECHRQGGMAPMPLVTYEEARPWARSIKEKVIKREMPPFHATGAVGRYHNDPRLTDAEIATITKWVDGGVPKGDAKDLPAPRVWKNEWQNGQPDLLVKVAQPSPIKPSQKDQYVF